MRVLLADDEKTIRMTLGDALRDAGHQVTAVADGQSAADEAERDSFDCVITDIRLPKLDGMEVIKRIKASRPDTVLIAITGFGTVESAVEALKGGAYDYLQKPFVNEEVLLMLERIQKELDLRSAYSLLKNELAGRYEFENLIGKCRKMQEVFELIRTVAPRDCSVVVEGESGTGKELVAQAIHYNSRRKGGPLVKMSCSVFPETLLEDELFGHERGAFTDAKDQRIGRFERSNGGTIFIDDIDDMSPKTQVKLLRILQEGEFERLGGSKTIKVDFRLVAATKVDLRKAVAQGKFREDLYYRLSVVTIRLPPLREREGDIPMLLRHFIKRLSKDVDFDVPADALQALESYAWPGNVRELENSVERAIALAGDAKVLRREHLLRPARTEPAAMGDERRLRPLKEVVEQSEAAYIAQVLRTVAGHRGEAARVLGVSRKCLWEKMRDYGLE